MTSATLAAPRDSSGLLPELWISTFCIGFTRESSRRIFELQPPDNVDFFGEGATLVPRCSLAADRSSRCSAAASQTPFVPAVRIFFVILFAAAGDRAHAQRPPAPDPGAPVRALLSAPDGDTIARLSPATPVLRLMEEGAWVRVRIEGWLPREQAIASDSDGGVGTTTLSAVRADPDRYVGTVVRWRVQSLGLQRADSLRSDLSPGESYLLARDPGGEAGFVYVVVPPERLPEVSALVPLQRVEVQARVRNGRSPLTGHPILDLLELHP